VHCNSYDGASTNTAWDSEATDHDRHHPARLNIHIHDQMADDGPALR
jgi:hypothetical protein